MDLNMEQHCQIVDFSEREFSTGHRTLFQFHVDHLAAKLSWPFRQFYETKCSSSPTSWLLEMLFNSVTSSGEVNIGFILSRMDEIDCPVSVYTRVEITDDHRKIPFLNPETFNKHEMLPGANIDADITGWIELPHIRASFNDQIFVTVILSVYHCHSAIKRSETTNLDTACFATTGSETKIFATTASDATGSDSSSSEKSGSETLYSKTLDSKTPGSETSGSDITDFETAGYDTTGSATIVSATTVSAPTVFATIVSATTASDTSSNASSLGNDENGIESDVMQ